MSSGNKKSKRGELYVNRKTKNKKRNERRIKQCISGRIHGN